MFESSFHTLKRNTVADSSFRTARCHRLGDNALLYAHADAHDRLEVLERVAIERQEAPAPAACFRLDTAHSEGFGEEQVDLDEIRLARKR